MAAATGNQQQLHASGARTKQSTMPGAQRSQALSCRRQMRPGASPMCMALDIAPHSATCELATSQALQAVQVKHGGLEALMAVIKGRDVRL